MKKAKCRACGEIQMRYNRTDNSYSCTCGHVEQHHPDLCPIYHKTLGCIYARKGMDDVKGVRTES